VIAINFWFKWYVLWFKSSFVIFFSKLYDTSRLVRSSASLCLAGLVSQLDEYNQFLHFTDDIQIHISKFKNTLSEIDLTSIQQNSIPEYIYEEALDINESILHESDESKYNDVNEFECYDC
jgi:hypothetical protein